MFDGKDRPASLGSDRFLVHEEIAAGILASKLHRPARVPDKHSPTDESILRSKEASTSVSSPLSYDVSSELPSPIAEVCFYSFFVFFAPDGFQR